MSEIRYDCRWSDQVDDQFINDYNLVANCVFGGGFDKEAFNRKFVKNIYGASVVVVVYIDDKPSAARALWRNDLDGKCAFQPGDTCVLKQCRGLGIFKEMTKRALSLLPENAIIYNFPNKNSYPGYIKMGWKLYKESYPVYLFSLKKYLREHSVPMDDEYANWWVVGRKHLRYKKIKGHYFLTSRTPHTFILNLICEVSESIALSFEKETRIALLQYDSQNLHWYNSMAYYKKGRASHIVYKFNDKLYIPSWKIDAI